MPSKQNTRCTSQASKATTDEKNATSLSQYIWTLKDTQIKFNREWTLITKAKSHSPTTNRCNLCLNEKYCIIFQPYWASLNNGNGLAMKRKHKKQLLLANQ